MMRKDVLISDQLYFAARDGMAITIVALLDSMNYDDVQNLLNQEVCDEIGQKCTPLIIAAKNGHEKVVKVFIGKYGVNMEQKGCIKIDNSLVEGASPLWAAAAAGHLNIVKILVKQGAKVNHTTNSRSTPVRAACYNGRLDIVKYLVEHNGDIHLPNKYNSSCLMIACNKGHIEIVTFLLEKGVDISQKALCGSTAMHFAAECGHVEIVKILKRHGAKMQLNASNMTPLLSAAERTKLNVVEYFIKQDEFTKQEKIDGLELLGASFANDKDNYSVELCYLYLHKAMTLRFEDPNNIMLKPYVVEPNPAYDGRIECQNLEELESIKNNVGALHMESLVIRERILGPHNPDVAHSVIYRGAVFADHMIFEKCILLWLHALHLSQLNCIPINKDLLRFSQIFGQMCYLGIPIKFEYLETILSSAVSELSKLKKEYIESQVCDPVDNEIFKDELELGMINSLCIVTIVTKIKSTFTEVEQFKIDKLIYQLVKVGGTTIHGYTLLHLAVDADTPVDTFHTCHVCKFPCANTVKQLIKCGADVNAMDNYRNTPLHVIVGYNQPINDFTTLHSIIVDLLDHGAHFDTVNMSGMTPIEAATTGVADIILKSLYPFSLKCLAAKVIQKYNIDYIGIVPKHLESFIELHGPGWTVWSSLALQTKWLIVPPIMPTTSSFPRWSPIQVLT